jgi:hypothetical protein
MTSLFFAADEIQMVEWELTVQENICMEYIA